MIAVFLGLLLILLAGFRCRRGRRRRVVRAAAVLEGRRQGSRRMRSGGRAGRRGFLQVFFVLAAVSRVISADGETYTARTIRDRTPRKDAVLLRGTGLAPLGGCAGALDVVVEAGNDVTVWCAVEVGRLLLLNVGLDGGEFPGDHCPLIQHLAQADLFLSIHLHCRSRPLRRVGGIRLVLAHGFLFVKGVYVRVVCICAGARVGCRIVWVDSMGRGRVEAEYGRDEGRIE